MITFEQLLLEVAIDQLRRDWVDSGKMDADLFDMICQMARNQSAYATWLVKKMGDDEHWRQTFVSATRDTAARDNIIRGWNEWFDTFTRYKQYFDKKDINQYKTSKDVAEWVSRCIEVKREVEAKKRSKDVDRFKIGTVEIERDGQKVGYVVYKLPKGHEENRQISIELGRHEPDVSGWCTAYDGDLDYWKNHISKEDLYIFINPKDKLNDKFQIQFNYSDSRPFPVRTDEPMNDVDVIPYLPFYDFLQEKEGRAYPKFVQNIRKAQENLQEYFQTEHSDSLEPFKFADGSYKIVFNADNLDWVAPALRGILRLEQLDEKLVSVFIFEVARIGKSRPYYFVETGDDAEPFKCFSTYDSDQAGTVLVRDYYSPLVRCKKPKPEFFCYESDGNNRILYDNIKAVAKKLPATLDRSLLHIFKGFIREDKARARAEALAARRAQREAERQARQNGRTAPAPAASIDLAAIDRWKIATQGSTTYYMFEQGLAQNVITRLFLNNDDLYNRLFNWVENGVLGLVYQNDVMVLLSNLTSGSRHLYTHVLRVNVNTGVLPGNMNPDTLYELYKVFKEHDESVVYPAPIRVIDRIRRGELERFAVPNVGRTTKLYKLAPEVAGNMPYTMPRDYENSRFVLLGFISKWQFALDSNGGFMLTGRWGSGGTRSWIQSVPGLTETLTTICREYNIPVVRALAALQEMCERYGVECPKILQEALLYEVKYI